MFEIVVNALLLLVVGLLVCVCSVCGIVNVLLTRCLVVILFVFVIDSVASLVVLSTLVEVEVE